MGYVIIYNSKNLKIELSTNGTVLRMTSTKNGVSYEYLYERVTDPELIRAIEDRSVNWIKRYFRSSYYIFMQADAKYKYTGNIKIIDKNKSVVGKFSGNINNRPEDFSYYVKRKV